MKKKLLAFALSLTMIAGLAACGDGNTEETKNVERPAYVYVPEYFDWGVEEPENGYINTYGVVNGYMLGIKSEWSNETSKQTENILKYSVVDGTLEEIPYISDNSNEYINAITVQQDGGIAACVQEYIWDEKTGVGQSFYRVIFMDASGQVTGEMDLADIYAEMVQKSDYAYINNIAVDSDGAVYLQFEQEIVAAGPDGRKLFSVETDNWIQNMGSTSDGSVYAVYYGQSGSELGILDKNAKAFGTKYKLENYNLNGFFHITEDNMLYFNDSTSMRKMNLETGECEELFQWLSVDMNGQYVDGVIIWMKILFLHIIVTGAQMKKVLRN